MIGKIIAYLGGPQQQKNFKKADVKRAKNYDVGGIMERFVADVGLKH